MMAKISWLECRTEYFLLLLAASGLSILPPASCQICNTNLGEPLITISSSPSSHKLPIGATINLTCTAWQTNELAMRYPKTRPHRIEWFDPQDKRVGNAVKPAGSPAAPRMKCTLIVDALTEEKFGNYTCKASNGDNYCSNKRFQISFQDIERPEVVKDPVSQSAVIGSNVAFNCTATGYPKPTITWKKDNDSYSVKYNPRARVIADVGKGFSHLVITGVKSDDYGKYQCVANNSAGVNTSRAALLHQIEGPEVVKGPVSQSTAIGSNVTFNCTATGYPKPTITWKKDNDSYSVQSNPRARVIADEGNNVSQLVLTGVNNDDYGKYQCVANNSAGENTSKPASLRQKVPSPLEKSQSATDEIIAITVPCVTFTMLIIAAVCLWHRKRKCVYNTRYDNENPEPSVTYNRTSQEENQEENTHNYASSIAPQENEEVQFSGHNSEENPLLEKLRVDLSERNRPQVRPLPSIPSPKVEWNSGQNVMRSSMLQSGSLDPNFEARTLNRKDGGCDIPERRDNIKYSPAPRRPQKPGKEIKEKTKHNEVCSSVLQSGSQNLKFETSEATTLDRKDCGSHSLEKRGSIQHSPAPHRPPKPRKERQEITEQNKMCCIKSQKIEEDYEIDLKRFTIQSTLLGEGEFGIVYRGSYCCKDEKVIDVAVKQLKDNRSLTDRAALLSEIRMLKQAGRHPNIVNLVGACTQGEKILLVTDLIPGDSLETLLNCKRAPGECSKYENDNCALNDRELVNIALQIASGMQHLETKKCIHGDLAARNVFIDNDNKVAKLGDFGLARDISESGVYTKTSNGKVPWRWLSIESLRHRVYTTQSDVWSFGILLWEIATYGEVPYPDITTPAALIRFLSSGNRMPRPEHCYEELYELMQSCWMENPLMRPTFNDITKQIKYLLREIKKPYGNVTDDDITTELVTW